MMKMLVLPIAAVKKLDLVNMKTLIVTIITLVLLIAAVLNLDALILLFFVRTNLA
jgi:hypothetical protein